MPTSACLLYIKQVSTCMLRFLFDFGNFPSLVAQCADQKNDLNFEWFEFFNFVFICWAPRDQFVCCSGREVCFAFNNLVCVSGIVLLCNCSLFNGSKAIAKLLLLSL